MKQTKLLKKIALSSVFAGSLAIALASCSSGTSGFVTYSATNFFDSDNTPLNSNFQGSPNSIFAQSMYLGLLNYQTVGQFETSSDGFSSTPTTVLTLEGAKAVIVFDNEETMGAFDSAKNINLSQSQDKSVNEWNDELKDFYSFTGEVNGEEVTYVNGENYWIFFRDKGGIEFQDNSENGNSANESASDVTELVQTNYYANAISNATVYQFLIDTDIQWVDTSGNEKQNLSSKDFERGFEGYYLSSLIGLNRNEYFIDLIGMDFEKTVGYESGGSYVDITSSSYDVENYTNGNDSFFTFYINETYPYAFGLLTKEGFYGLPHTNDKVKVINLNSGKVALSSDGQIDESNTVWKDIFGSGNYNQANKGMWFAGAYYVKKITSTQMVFSLNNSYMDVVGQELLNYNTGLIGGENTDSRIEKVTLIYGSGTTNTFYEKFKSGQNSYLSSVPSESRDEAARLYASTSLYPTKVIQTSQSNYMTYTPNPWLLDTSTSKIKINNYMGNMGKFSYSWNSLDATIIRAGIAGLVNHYQLSQLAITSGDFQLSATPYGGFANYYENVADGNLYGGLPREYSEYKSDSSGTTFGYTSDSNAEDFGFDITYYEYKDDSISTNIINVNPDTFQKSLSNFGATESNPLEFSMKFGEGSFSTNYQTYLDGLASALDTVSGGLLKFGINERSGNNPTFTEWYYNQSSPLGFSYWSPDYNGVGTWIEADTTLQSSETSTTQGEGDDAVSTKLYSFEAKPGTNAHNAYITYLSNMVTAVHFMGASWDEDSNQYVISSLPESDPYEDDIKIQAAFGDDSLSSFDIDTSTSSESESYDESNATDSGFAPGIRYGLLSIGLLNKLIENGVFNQSVFDEYVSNPSKLNYDFDTNDIMQEIQENAGNDNSFTNATYQTESAQDVYDSIFIGGDVINEGLSSSFSKYLGVYCGESIIKALYATTVLDSDYSYVPRAEAGINETSYALVASKYVARVGTQDTTYRDFGLKN